jgi:hypothetical protein
VQCCGSAQLTYESGSVDPYYCPDPDLGPALFISDLQDASKKPNFFACYFVKVHLHQSPKIKSHKIVTTVKSRFFLLILLDRYKYLRTRTGRSKNFRILHCTDPGPDPQLWLTILKKGQLLKKYL